MTTLNDLSRVAHIKPPCDRRPLVPLYSERLNRLLRQAADVARADFGGPITYGAKLWEFVDWKPFDIIGLDYYRIPYNRARYVTKLRKFKRHGKPVVVVDPRYDLDMAGYSLMKIIQDTPDGPYRWEPKVAFDTVAKLYAGFGSGMQVPAAQREHRPRRQESGGTAGKGQKSRDRPTELTNGSDITA